MPPVSLLVLGSVFSDCVVDSIMLQIIIFCDSCHFLARVLILVSQTSTTAMMYRPIELKDSLRIYTEVPFAYRPTLILIFIR